MKTLPCSIRACKKTHVSWTPTPPFPPWGHHHWGHPLSVAALRSWTRREMAEFDLLKHDGWTYKWLFYAIHNIWWFEIAWVWQRIWLTYRGKERRFSIAVLGYRHVSQLTSSYSSMILLDIQSSLFQGPSMILIGVLGFQRMTPVKKGHQKINTNGFRRIWLGIQEHIIAYIEQLQFYYHPRNWTWPESVHVFLLSCKNTIWAVLWWNVCVFQHVGHGWTVVALHLPKPEPVRFWRRNCHKLQQYTCYWTQLESVWRQKHGLDIKAMKCKE